jgi:hypothetical protein
LKTILGYIRRYFRETNGKVAALTALLASVLIFINYGLGLNEFLEKKIFPVKLIGWYIVFALAFGLPYLFYAAIQKRKYPADRKFQSLFFIAPAIFALKLALDIPIRFSENSAWNNYWNYIFYWPLLVLITGGLVYIVWVLFDRKHQPFYGIRTKGINWRPYFLMLLIMLPVVAIASTQADFQAVYPKLQSIEGIYGDKDLHDGHILLFELSYGTDFISIELFFRGFLVLAFARIAGQDAILPMACFYCTIHFGKPLGECISSYFGGLLLGIVVYHTRSIFGGLIVHLGIAWMMELGGIYIPRL